MSASSQHLYTKEIMKFPHGTEFHDVKYACGLAHTSLVYIEKFLSQHGLSYTAVKSGETMESVPEQETIIFISTQSFFRSLPSVKNKTSIVIDGMLKLVEAQGLPILDAKYSCIQQVATRWDAMEPDLSPILSPSKVKVRARRINFGLLTLTAATNAGLYQKLLTLVENNSNPSVQREIIKYVSKLVYGGTKTPSYDDAIAYLTSLSSENMTRAAFIEKLVDAVFSSYGERVSNVLRDNKDSTGDDLWEMEDTHGLMRGDLFLTRGLLHVPT